MQARAGRGDAGEGKEAVDGVERDEPRAAREERCDAGEAARRAHVLVERGRVAHAVEDKVERAATVSGVSAASRTLSIAAPRRRQCPSTNGAGANGTFPPPPPSRRLGVDVEVVGRAEDATREREVGGRRVQQAVRAGGERGAEVPAGRGAERRDGLQVGVAQQRVDGDERPDVEAVCVGALVCPARRRPSPARRTEASGHRPARRR